jgi:DNA-directed RNA polymerase subunit M/transcription elongation factor TFIIS
MIGSEKRHTNRRQNPDRRKPADGLQIRSEGTRDSGLADAPALPRAESRVCTKCGSARTAITANLTEEAHHLSLFRCEICGFRFSHLTSAES